MGPLPPGPYACLTVSDTGMGMSAEVMGQMFDPFFTTKGGARERVAPSDAEPRSGGAGLGLSTVYGIVKQSNGGIVVASELEKGSALSVFLPAISGTVERRVSDRHLGEADSGTETLLVVEDQRSLRSAIARALKDLGYRVLEAGDPNEALREAAAHDGAIDLLLTDVVMPHMRGPELARRVVESRPGLKVLYMSGYPDDTLLDRGVSFLAKPFSPDLLGRKVRELLDGK
jgi:two-component system cell cycle sensor histidine kinase/response regulator CckA